MSRSWMSHVLPVVLEGGVSPTFLGRRGSPRLPQQRSALPFRLTRCSPNYEQGLKRQQQKKEARTYSRKGLPGGSRRRIRRGPRPEMVTAASRHLRISPPPLPSFGTPRSLRDAPSDAGPCPHHLVPPQTRAAPGFCGKHPPHTPQNLPSLRFAAAFAFSLGHQLTGS